MFRFVIVALVAFSGCIQFARSDVSDATGADAVGDSAGDLPLRDYAGEFDPLTSFMPHHYCDDGRGPVECCHNSECPNDVAGICDHGVCLDECAPTSECCYGGMGECPDDRLFCNQNVCEDFCEPACDGRECGAATNCGKADVCGTCPAWLQCRGGRCQEPLVP